ncbi:hypothetical protein [Plastoroseomonas arctica]|uniref:Uncharacterized protein n=1 Tax=Plastoroseomonas arctica TaxID=1509237 RepID=A0AAF1KQY8_9PROT|nr:hypothetical protein [Plastoroseomonas arctica]MBR0653697.1 hypothetical protein [Plastoroseomonas arctica]
MKTILLGLVGLAAFIGIAAATAPPVDCADPVLHSVSPDARHSLAICRGQRLVAMPGQSGDAPGHAVLRDATGRIEGVVAIEAINAVGHAPRWEEAAVDLPLIARIGYARGTTMLDDGFWRLRAWLRAVPRDEEFR